VTPSPPGPADQATAGDAGAPGPDGWVDSHCHLQDAYVTGERGPGRVPGAGPGDGPSALVAGALGRAASAGVVQLVCVGTGPQTSAGALALARASAAGDLGPSAPGVWATAGLHPHEASEGAGAIVELLEASVGSGLAVRDGGRLVAVGECGLDYHYEHSPRDAQRRAFAEQVAAARRLGLALVIHAREAWEDLFDVLSAEGVPERTVLHCFTGGAPEARRALDMGMYVSFSGIVTFKNAEPVREALRLCPLDRLLVETDSPFLAPAPHRGRPNEPAYVAIVGDAVAATKELEPAEVAAATTANAQAVFGL
jgi:TatD DNase family protein